VRVVDDPMPLAASGSFDSACQHSKRFKIFNLTHKVLKSLPNSDLASFRNKAGSIGSEKGPNDSVIVVAACVERSL
jgi:hypothetical protein